MYQKFTQETNDYCHVVNNEKKSNLLTPAKETLSFLMQFARAYHVEKNLPLGISGMVLN
jgi:hypothetical protein